MKKLLSVLMASALAIGSMAGCGSPATASSEAPSGGGASSTAASEASSQKAGVKISVAHCQGEWCWPMLQEIIDDYKKTSGNDVELIYVPADSTATWVTTQFTGDTAPDVIWATGTNVADYYKNGWTIDLKPYYEGKSNYTGATWQDSFRDGLLAGVKDPNGTGAYIGMPISATTVNMYYNSDIFTKLNLNPDDLFSWSGVLETAKKIKEADPEIVPMSVQNSMSWNLGWTENFMMEEIWNDVVEKLDIVDKDGRLQQVEVAAGIKSGIIKLDDQRMTDYFSFMKDLSKYFNEGFNSASWEYEALFNEGKSAMVINGSWFPNQVLQNGLTVNYGTGPIPYVDDKITAGTDNHLRKYSIGLGGPEMYVSKKAFDQGRGDAAIDFLQYVSDPASGAKLMTEKMMTIPVVKDVTVPKEMEGIVQYIGEDEQRVGWNANLLGMTPEANDKYRVLFANFLDDGSITPEQCTQSFKELYEEATDEAVANHPEWKMDEILAQLK